MATGLFNSKQVNQAVRLGAWSGYMLPQWVEYLVVAGGGAGGDIYGGGGGGAGGLLTGIVTVTAGTSYTVTVGSGGSRVTGEVGNSGNNSLFGAISAAGGGGGSAPAASNLPGLTGGSGGGGRNDATPYGGSGIPGQGNSGGKPFLQSGSGAGGGGGGAGSAGNLAPAAGQAGNGGSGVASAITGILLNYAGGGGGGTQGGSAGFGGIGGGGTGGYNTAPSATSGSANTGGGGGGGGSNNTNYAGNGGSGVVVIRYPGNVQFYTGGAITYVNGYIIHTFYVSGTLAPTTPTVYSTAYTIPRSLRFNKPDNGYLVRDVPVATNRKTWTVSMWVKYKVNGDYYSNVLFAARYSGSPYSIFDLQGTQGTQYSLSYNDSNGTQLITTASYRDPSAWFHVVLAVDTTQATASNRAKLYVNGVQVTAFGTATYCAQNSNTEVNSATTHTIGGFNPTVSTINAWDGYMTEVYLIDGQQLTPSSFGETNANTNVWQPKAYTGTYGTNGFYINFSDNSNTTAATLGKDYSGNGNNYTPNNFSVTAGVGNDSMVDSPTSYGTDYGVGGAVRGNYCTLNPLAKGTNTTLSNGNLQSVTATSWTTALGTFGISSGKWYWEYIPSSGTYFICGILASNQNLDTYIGEGANGFSYQWSGNKQTNSTASSYGASYGGGDVIGVAFDADAGTLTFYKNGASQGTAFSNLKNVPYFPAVSGYTAETAYSNFGQRAWAYTPPAGFKALCTQNLPAPTIGSNSTNLANQYFTPVTYTGDGTNNRFISAGMTPDWTWIKERSRVGSHFLFDTVRGTGVYISSNGTGGDNYAGSLSWTNSGPTTGGFKVDLGTNDGINYNTGSFIAWNWKAGGTGVTNTSGTITTTVSANTTSGFSIAKGTTPASGGASYGHGLGVAPSFIVAKCTSTTSDWFAYHVSVGFNQDIRLNSTAAASSTTFTYNSADASIVTIGGSSVSAYWGGNATWVWYNFAPVPGYSAFGSYTGNGSSNGPFLYLGFTPAYILIKQSSANATDWRVITINTSYLSANTTAAQYDSPPGPVRGVSNGVQIIGTGGDINQNGSTFIYAAFAANPFKYALALPQ